MYQDECAQSDDSYQPVHMHCLIMHPLFLYVESEDTEQTGLSLLVMHGHLVGMHFFCDEGKEDPNSTKPGHHRPANEMPLNGVSLAGR